MNSEGFYTNAELRAANGGHPVGYAHDTDEAQGMIRHNLDRYAELNAVGARMEHYQALADRYAGGQLDVEAVRYGMAAEVLDAAIAQGKLAAHHRAGLLAVLKSEGHDRFLVACASVVNRSGRPVATPPTSPAHAALAPQATGVPVDFPPPGKWAERADWVKRNGMEAYEAAKAAEAHAALVAKYPNAFKDHG